MPFAENDQAKRLGARWDGEARTWYVPPTIDPTPFSRWRLDGPATWARVVALPERCHRCGAPTRSIVGVLVDPELGSGDPEGFLQFDERLAKDISRQLDAAALAELGIGPLKRRFSRTVGRPYLSNGCVGCDALQGDFPLLEATLEYRAGGGVLEDLVVTEIELPLSALPTDQLEED